MIKKKFSLFIIVPIVFMSCSKATNSPEFIEMVSGNYLFNSDEVIKVYFENDQLLLTWRGADAIKPLQLNDSSFFVKEMNKKIQFRQHPETQLMYISFIPKNKDSIPGYNFRKMLPKEEIPSGYLDQGNFDKALAAYKKLQVKDSLDPAIDEKYLNSTGYKELRKNNLERALQIFKINVALYPESSNVYDSLGEAYMKNKDTVEAIKNYKKSLELDSGNKRAERIIARLENGELD